MPRFVYNARTGELSGVTSIKVGDPQVSIQEYVTNYVASNKSQVYDSDLVAATLAKNFNTGGSLGFDSDQVVAIINENVVSSSGGFDSDQIVAIIAENVRDFQDSDESAVSILRNDLESDANFTNLKILEIRNLLDSESSKVQSLKTRIYDTISDNDSDFSIDIQALKLEADSDEQSLAGVKRFILGTNPSPNNIFEHYSSSGAFGYNPFHDSDLVIASAVKGFNVASASYDSDRVVQTITTAGEIALKDYFLDSEEVFNMGTEHGWNFDSDKIMQSVTKNINSTITISGALNDLLDSEEVVNMFVEHEIATQSDIDSEIALIKIALDSETARIQLLLSNADSDQIAIAELRVSADSDTTVIQSLRSQAELDQAQITLIRNDLDSDTTAIQALNTRVDSDYARTNTRFVSIEGDVNTLQAQNTVSISRLNALEANEDSDYAQLKAEIAAVSSGFDSDQVVAIINENTTSSAGMEDSDLKAVADLRNDVDSDFGAFNTRIGVLEAAVDNTGFDSDQVVAIISENETAAFDDSIIVARLDSDSIRIQDHGTRIGVLEAAVDDTGFDSDQVVAIINENSTSINDSDLKAVADLRTDLDSDFSAFNTRVSDNYNSIQTLNSTTNSQGGRITLLEARRDSESAKVQTINGTVATLQSTQNAYGGRLTTLESRADSDETAIQALDTTLGTLSTKVTSIESALDSETARIQLLLLSTDSDALSIAGLVQEADSDAAAIAELLRQADSDAIAIQALKTDLTADINTLTSRVDSDELAIQAAKTDMDVNFTITAGSGIYIYNGDGFPSAVNNPTLYLERGQTYNFRVNASGHPFQIRQSNGGAAYSDGVTNNGAQVGLIKFVVPMNAPDTLVYQCTAHANMIGNIKIGKAGFDSDQIVSIINNTAQGLTDSDLKAIADLRNDVDSDSVKIQLMQGSISALESGTYNDAPLVARLDSDTAAISALRTELDGLSGTAAISTVVYTYTATQGQTTFTGADSNGLTLNYSPSKIYVFLNGILILDTIDYTATNGSSIVLTQAADSDNTLQVIKHVGTVQTGFDSDQVVAIINEHPQIKSLSTTTTGQTQQSLDSFPTGTYRSVEYFVSASSNNNSWFASKVIVIHDGTTAYLTEYGVVSTHDSEFITFDADINSGNVRLLGTPSNSLTNVKMQRTAISQS